ncbi:MAG: sporulation integral membrane protein YtvI [Firmicutes bacterium]|nr:sporulation integral membrane protein YtvI [Bacillota bacterium]
MNTEKQKIFLIKAAYTAVLLFLTYFMFKYAISFVMPFIIAYVFAAAIRRPAVFLTEKFRMKRSVASIICTVVFFIIIGGALTLLCVGIYSYLKNAASNLPEFFSSTVAPTLDKLSDFLTELPEKFDPQLATAIQTLIDTIELNIGTILTSISSFAVGFVSDFISALPSFVVKVIFCVISTYYFTADYKILYGFIRRQFSDETYEKIDAVRVAVRDTLFSYIKSYATIMSITFVELLIATLIMRVDNAPAVSLAIAVFDILPVVGTGTILIPWAVIEILWGKYAYAVGLIVTYVIIFVVRQIIEPKIVGHHVGLHPLVTILCMFFGSMLFGAVGLFGVPIFAAIIVELNQKGIIHIFK